MVMVNDMEPASLRLGREPIVSAEQKAGWFHIVAKRKTITPTGIKLHFLGRLVSSLLSIPTELPVLHLEELRGISTYPVQILVRMQTNRRWFSYSV
jgi:hypothetical protein